MAEGGVGDHRSTGRRHFLTREAFVITTVIRKRSGSYDSIGTMTKAAVANSLDGSISSSNSIGGIPPLP